MSRFYGVMKGTRGEVTRLGHKTSGLRTTAASYSGCVRTQLWYDASTDTDMVSVWIQPWQGHGVSLRLYEGPVNPSPTGDVDAALRCRTCVNFEKWQANTQGQ